MARKPAQNTKPETVADDKEKPVADAVTTNTEGAQSADQSAVAPTSTPADDGQGATGGEDGSDLPAINPAETDGPGPLVPVDGEIVTIGIDLAEPVADLVVLCHRKDGRRRAGQKWPHGETRISSADLTDFQLAQLRSDPAFTVFYTEKE